MVIQESHASNYDAVLVAVPLELTNITISGAERTGLPRRVYQRTVATLVRGRLRPAYFGVEEVPKGVSMLPEASRCSKYLPMLRFLLSCPAVQQGSVL